MLALGTGMIVLMVATGVGLGLVGGWLGFRWRHKGRVFSETDREYFQNLLYRSETAEAKLETMEPELGRTRDRANILEDSHRIIQEELANERQFNLSLNAELSRERAHRKFLEDKLRDQAEALEAAQRRIDGELANLAKRIGENTQTITESLPAARDAGEPAFAAATY
jgi:chromosome segregation ATPase